tara:strand:+ start:6235 stop:6414 length:180 start_codon:yes stop_codon:yes gene_type:complete
MFEEPEVGGVENLKKAFLFLHTDEILEAIDVQRIPVVDEKDLGLHGVPLDLMLQNEAAR